MKRIIRKAIILMMIFLIGVSLTVILRDQERTDTRGDFNAASLPEVLFEYDGIPMNRTSAYKQKMQVDFTRDNIVPVDTQRTFTVLVDPYGAEIYNVSYEIRTSDGGRVVENKKLKNLETVDGRLRSTETVSQSILMDQEYSLQITVECSKGTLYYYSRILQRSIVNAAEYMRFALEFNDKTFDKAKAQELGPYMESDANMVTNYSKTTLKSKWDQMSWGELKPVKTMQPIPCIKDINPNACSVILDYQVEMQNEHDQVEKYQVEEFYRLRLGDGEMLVLDMQRCMYQIFDADLPVLTSEGLILGVTDRDVNYQTNEDNTMISFVQAGDLWTYETRSGKMTRVFSFREETESDYRDSKMDHDYKIVRVWDDGDLDFILFGYMNRGAHEGYSGVSVCHYDSEQNLVTEKVFVPSTESFEFLKNNLGTLSYVNEDNQLFLLFAGKLYRVNLKNHNYEVLAEGVKPRDFRVSETNRHAAWISGSDDGVNEMKTIDFESSSIRVVRPPEGHCIEVLGYFNEDLAYGLALMDNILPDSRGNDVIGLSVIQIETPEGEIKKTYQNEYLVTDVKMNDTLMELTLSQKTDQGYVEVRKDNIMNSIKVNAAQISLQLYVEERRGNIVRMAVSSLLQDRDALEIVSKMNMVEYSEIYLDMAELDENDFYVYAKGHLDNIYANPAQAVLNANDLLGVVMNRNQQYVWERGNWKSTVTLDPHKMPDAFLTGSLDVKKLQLAMGDGGTVLDMTGCPLELMYYYISKRAPVIVKTGDRATRLIVGYDDENMMLYNFRTKETETYEKDDCEELFEKNGNVFVTFLERLEE